LADPDGVHRFEITAEITDASRRTVVGKGVVRVGRKPFTVYTSVDRGYYRAGDPIEAEIQAQTLDRKPVAGKGTLQVLKVAYDAERRPVETLVEKRDLTLDSGGHARQILKAAAPGQYRLSATIDDGKGHAIEGGYLLTIIGEGLDSASCRFNDLEIIEVDPIVQTTRPGF
jgi:alpha-2-macroglobulin